MNASTDELLMQRLQDGHTDACGALYSRYKKVLYAYFFNNCHNEEVSEDLVQVTFEKILKSRKNFSGRGSFKSWMFAIARNAYIDEYQKHSKQNKLEQRILAHPANQTIHYRPEDLHDDRELLWKALDLLDNEKREILVMTKLHGMKYKEVCEILNLSETNLKIKVFRIMKELRIYINRLLFDQTKNYGTNRKE